MIEFKRKTLSNGLKIIVHTDKTSPLAAVNLLYNVGARDEDPDRTGFAHLFEHLMFGGSINIPSYDNALQSAGGDNNAFTNNDITNYYVTLPAENLETAFWLESDRMLSLAFTEKSLEVQRNVVIEEFKQRYLNQPYGDEWLLLRPLAYKKHPYLWSTIGKEISHIENARIEHVRDFFYKHYAPNNCILVVSGNVNPVKVFSLAEKWFGPIEKRNVPVRNLPVEPKQTKARKLEVERDVPVDSLYKVYHMSDRKSKDYYSTDLLSDLLSNGKSSRLYQNLVKEKKMFSQLDAYITGSIDAGLFVVEGKLADKIKMKTADQAVVEELEKICTKPLKKDEFQKVKNKVESTLVFSEMSILNKAMKIAFHELIGDAADINSEPDKYLKVTPADIKKIANEVFAPTNCSTLYYYSKKQ
ncbi:MAG: peptidase M16 [Bacteroidetes bacterium GWF2_38_335]|nr:MAG: peptidase M16 [Bacteroidetes bacterium GWF2_38_335]OFY80167.1 MAG: peptidase M16 [Bacteroidetes bacterium RIFOXYA12_FULL_38_20]HBS88503.1 peptidase M16 [Bacteroidales bacterium]